jgi:hypothetical protein
MPPLAVLVGYPDPSIWEVVRVANSTPTFNTHLPQKILTPDRVASRLDELEFFDGMPSDATAVTRSARRPGVELDADGAGQGLFYAPLSLWPTRAMIRPDLAPR